MKSARWRTRATLGWAAALAVALAGCTKTAESGTEGTPPLAPKAEEGAVGAIPAAAPAQAEIIGEAAPAAAAAEEPAEVAKVPETGARLAAARGAEVEAAPAKPEAAAKQGGEPAAKGGAGRMRAETDEYVVEVKAPAKADSGAASTVDVTIVPKGEWKLNMDFPTRLIVESPDGVAVDKASQRRQDAVQFDDDRGVFRMSFTAASAGAKAFKAQFRFAVCTDETCDPKREELAWVVDVR